MVCTLRLSDEHKIQFISVMVDCAAATKKTFDNTLIALIILSYVCGVTEIIVAESIAFCDYRLNVICTFTYTSKD